MSPRTIRFHEGAEQELNEAATYYEEQKSRSRFKIYRGT